MEELRAAREKAFCDGRIAPGAFHSVEHASDVFRPDPLDVGEIHGDARACFDRMVEGALTGDAARAGALLLLKGEAGAGKTHLMRAFRNTVHSRARGFFAYMQMTTSVSSYPRYLLHKVIDSFDEPYALPSEREPGLKILSNALTSQLPAARVAALRDADDTTAVRRVVHELADRLLDRLLVPQLDLDLVRALLLLQVDKPSIRARVTKYLRHEPLSAYDLEALGSLSPRHEDGDPIQDLAQLAAVLRRVLDRSLIVCVDQLEDIYNLDDARKRFPSAMDAVKQVAEIPGSVVVVSCLEGYYEQVKDSLSLSLRQRLEIPPSPITLRAIRTAEEVHRLLAIRLAHVFESAGVQVPEDMDLHPIPKSFVATLDGMTTRQVLSECHALRMHAIAEGRVPHGPGRRPTSVPPPPDLTDLQQAWNDAATRADVPDDERLLLDLLHDAIQACGRQVAGRCQFEPQPVEGALQFVVRQVGFDGAGPDLLVGLCDRSAKGNGLKNQLEELQENGTGRTIVVVRSMDYPTNPKTVIAKVLGKLVASGARRVKVEDVDWRRMAAFPKFAADHGNHPHFETFLRTERPLLSAQALRDILSIERLRASAFPPALVTPADPPPTPAAPERKTAGVVAQAEGRGPGKLDPIPIGRSLGPQSREIGLPVEALKRHAAFLGGTGSGKTTAAMQVIEQLLLRGIPAVVVDRKGDLAGYALDETWTASLGDPIRERLRDQLRRRVQVDLYTPGNPDGRSFAMRLLPDDFEGLSAHEQQLAARVTASAIAGMMNLRGQKLDRATAVLQTSLCHVGLELGPTQVSLERLVEYLANPDTSLYAALGMLKEYLPDLVVNLEVMLRNRGTLIRGDEPLDASKMLAPTSDGKVRLAIVSTKFVGSAADVQFWVSSLVSEFTRMGQRHPSNELQAVILLDEADLYLPANSQPASKQPVEDLLRRGRSAGLGVLLATQNPGDLDYRCRDNIISWFVGKLGQKTGTSKLELLFEGTPGNIQALAQQDIGQFHYIGERTFARIQCPRTLVDLPTQVSDSQILLAAARSRRGNKASVQSA